MTETEQAEALLLSKMEIRVGGKYWLWNGHDRTHRVKVTKIRPCVIDYCVKTEDNPKWFFPWSRGYSNSMPPNDFGQNLRLHYRRVTDEVPTITLNTPNLI